MHTVSCIIEVDNIESNINQLRGDSDSDSDSHSHSEAVTEQDNNNQ